MTGIYYTTKIKVFLCVCLSGYAFRRATRYGAETWYGGRRWASKAQEHIFEVTQPKVKGHPEVKLLKKWPVATRFCRKNPWPKCNAFLG